MFQISKLYKENNQKPCLHLPCRWPFLLMSYLSRVLFTKISVYLYSFICVRIYVYLIYSQKGSKRYTACPAPVFFFFSLNILCILIHINTGGSFLFFIDAWYFVV